VGKRQRKGKLSLTNLQGISIGGEERKNRVKPQKRLGSDYYVVGKQKAADRGKMLSADVPTTSDEKAPSEKKKCIKRNFRESAKEIVFRRGSKKKSEKSLLVL